MKNLLTKGLSKSFEVSIVIKNNIAQILIASALFVLCLGIAWSFIKGNSTITVKTAAVHDNRHGRIQAMMETTDYEPTTNFVDKVYSNSFHQIIGIPDFKPQGL